MECTLPACQSSTHLSAVLSSFSLLQKGITIIRLHILCIFHIFVYIFSIYVILKLCTLETMLLKLHCLNCTGCWYSLKQGFFSVSYASSHLPYLSYIKVDDCLLYTSFCGKPGVQTEWMNFPRSERQVRETSQGLDLPFQ